MRLLVLEIEEQPNCWPPFCKAFPLFNRQLGNRTMCLTALERQLGASAKTKPASSIGSGRRLSPIAAPFFPAPLGPISDVARSPAYVAGIGCR
jgi:hypothetical protein